MRFYKGFSLLMLVSILLISINNIHAQDIVFEETDCPFRKPANVTMDCGYLTVPENYNKADGKQIRLAVAIARNPSGNPEPDPIIYLEGGPGGSPLELLYLTFEYQFESLFAANRDIILLDQRGVGYSEPALDCPDMQKLSEELLDFELDGKTVTQEEAYSLIEDALITCGENLSIENDLSAYNSASNARDIESLRKALGYEKVNLWGISYGTRLALTMMRDYPEGIRSVLIDSVYPPDSNLFVEQAQNADRAFSMLFDNCEQDTLCNENYPNLRQVFFETVDKLNENPVTFSSPNPFTYQIYHVVFNGDMLVNTIFQLLYDSGSIPTLPKLIYQAAEGDFSLYSLFEGLLIAQQGVISPGMYFAVQCQDEISFMAHDELDGEWANYQEYSALEDSNNDIFAICAAFKGTSPEIENQAVVSDIPTLVTAGEYDPITPPAWAEQVAATLSNSRYIEFPYSGHGATATIDCPKTLVADFFLNPVPDELDTSCINDMEMVYSGTVEIELDFVTVSLADYSIPAETVVPEGWEEQNVLSALFGGGDAISKIPFLGMGMFARLENSLDMTSLTFLRIPVIRDVEQITNNLLTQLKIDPNDVINYQSNAVQWKIFPIEVWGIQGYLAFTTDNAGSILILMLGDDNSLYDSVLIPVLEAFKFD